MGHVTGRPIITADDLLRTYFLGERDRLICALDELEAVIDSPDYILVDGTTTATFLKYGVSIPFTNELVYVCFVQTLERYERQLADLGVTDLEPYHVRTDITSPSHSGSH